ncbi:O-antigen ligase family protein [Flagellimonas beolgyonensis]|uniref:O-antigen ligase family protein n=1 Tax=Flagellimonas beolgyonensis TaxID=864064 RepID=UPI003D65E799
MKRLIEISLLIFFCFFLFVPTDIFGVPFLKSYMLFFVLCGLFFLPLIKIYKLLPFEASWLLLMLYLPITILYCDDYASATKAIIGEAALVFFYFVFRFFLVEIGQRKFNIIICRLGKWFYIVSVAFFLLGTYFYYVKGVDYMPLFYTDQTNRVLGGIFSKWTNMPRLTGLSMGSYSFNWISSFFILVFLQNKLYKWAAFGLLCSLMTLSMTFVVLLIFVLAYIIFKKGKVVQALFAVFTFLGIGLYYFYTNPWFNNVIQSRLENAKTGTGRFEIWKYVLEKAWEKPFFGHGINQLKGYLEGYHDETIRSAHNTFFEIFFNGGLFGLILYLTFLATFFAACYNLDKRVKGYYFKGFFLCYLVFVSANTGIYIFDPLIFMSFIFLYHKHFQKSGYIAANRD